MKKTIITAVILLTVLAIFAGAPVVTNVTASQRTDGSKIVDITYDVSDAENDDLWIEVLVSDDSGATFDIEPDEANLTGDFGSEIIPGTGKNITWNAGNEISNYDGDSFQLKISASDVPPFPAGFVFVEGGTFQMGDRFGECGTGELPLHDVTLNDFYLSKYEVTVKEFKQFCNETECDIDCQSG